MTRFKGSDLLALGFMTFALFLGAGNIIFPASAGMASGDNFWPVAIGFLLTGVGLPALTIVALARVGGGMPELTSPLGRVAGIALAVAVYLAIGPLFATPRTAVVSFEIGVAPFTGGSWEALLGYSVIYFAVVLYLVMNPGRLLDRVGKVLTPLLLVALLLLGGAAIFAPIGPVGPVMVDYQAAPLLKGFLDGYLTMDAFGALVFGIVIASAIRDRGVTSPDLVTRYSIIAVIIAAIGLAVVYLLLFYLGATSYGVAAGASNGGQILTAYVQHTFGTPGLLLLAAVIILACLTTGVGLITACGEFFSRLMGVSYRAAAGVFVLFSLLVSNMGLSELIRISIPVLVGLYPLAIMLVLLSLADRLWRNPSRVLRPVMTVTFAFGLADGLAASGVEWLEGLVPAFFSRLPWAEQSMGWVLPVVCVLALAILVDRLLPAVAEKAAQH